MEEAEQNVSPVKKSLSNFNAEHWSFVVLFAGLAILPLFFIPKSVLSFDIAKGTVLFGALVVATLLWLIARMKSGRFVFPRSRLLGALAILPLVFLVSALFSKVPVVSLLGIEYETGTFFSVLMFTLLAFLSSIFFQSGDRIFKFYQGVILGSLVVFGFFVVGLLVARGVLPISLNAYLPANIVGKWDDLAAFFGLASLLSVMTLELLPLKKKFRTTLLAALGISLVMVALVNFTLLWLTIGAFALLVFVYVVSFGHKEQSETDPMVRKFPIFSFGVLLLSVFFVLASNPVGNMIRNTFQLTIPQEEIRPNWAATIDIAKNTILHSPVVGSGPNRFLNQWTLYKPAGVNTTGAWGIDFASGIGIIPSFATTLGLLGIVAWIIFLGLFVYSGVRTVFKVSANKVSHYLVTSSFLAAAYLWTIVFFYVPNLVIVALAFVMTGMFIAALVESEVLQNYNFSFLLNPRTGFVAVLVLILLTISTIASGYFVVEKFLSLSSFQKGVLLARDGNYTAGRVALEQARELRDNDLYYRTISDIDMGILTNIINKTGVSAETIKQEFLVTSQDAISNAIKATTFDPTNYLNFITLGRAYEALIPFGPSQEFYENTKKNYTQAGVLNPTNPAIPLMLARLELAGKNIAGAKEYINIALTLKRDYVAAIFLLAQIQSDEGDIDKAIESTEVASIISPDDIGVFFQLGFLRYKNKDYAGAVSALERAVELNSSYSNARYFLGLSYSSLNRVKDAIYQFEQIQALNPDNKEVKTILSNLRGIGKPFLSVDAGAKSPPDKRSTPPLNQ
ncbi:MAG: Tetratricopeptide TPR_1 repeat-containing protein [Parcubacteria group bacterium GW2011_GWA2_49_16]|nr:MAG: Tetratricopeptide TPR_1 repeat-containing protein [Parcubacteria group bacterium GW2011_GWA2_49_16]